VKGAGCRDQGFGFRVHGFGCRVLAPGMRRRRGSTPLEPGCDRVLRRVQLPQHPAPSILTSPFVGLVICELDGPEGCAFVIHGWCKIAVAESRNAPPCVAERAVLGIGYRACFTAALYCPSARSSSVKPAQLIITAITSPIKLRGPNRKLDHAEATHVRAPPLGPLWPPVVL